MKKQKLKGLLMLCLLLVVGVVYSVQVFVSYNRVVIEAVHADINDDKTETSEENVKETSHHLFIQERTLYHLKPLSSVAVNFTAYFDAPLPEAYLQLNTPPPNCA